MSDELLDRIMDSEKWPAIQLPENLELLNEMADKCFEAGSFEDMLAATLMYHQILEAMCIHLLEDCNFFIQLSVYPRDIELKIPKDKMFGYYIKELKASISFGNKEEFLLEAEEFNSYRVDIVHRMRKSNLDSLKAELSKTKDCFNSIYELYDQIQDEFNVAFHGFKKDVFIDYLSDEE